MKILALPPQLVQLETGLCRCQHQYHPNLWTVLICLWIGHHPQHFHNKQSHLTLIPLQDGQPPRPLKVHHNTN